MTRRRGSAVRGGCFRYANLAHEYASSSGGGRGIIPPWTMPREWRYATPSIHCAATVRVSLGGKQLSDDSYFTTPKLGPRGSVTRHRCVPFGLSTSNSSISSSTHGCGLSSLMMRDSASWRTGSASARRNFSATRRGMTVSWASQTVD